MSWAEISRINSDFTTPLNVLSTINQIDLCGRSAFDVSSAKNIVPFLRMTEVYNHPIALSVIGDTFTNALMHETNNVGMLLDSAFDLNSAELRSCQTFADVLANDAALLAIGDSEKLGAMLFALSPSNYINFVGSDYSLLRMSRQGLLKKAFFSEQHIEVAREKSHIERTLVTYAKQFVEEVDSTFTFDRDLFVVVVAVGAGADGAVNGKGGDGGDYL